MGQLYDEDWEHVDIEAYRKAIIGNGVISGLQVTQSDTPGMTVKVSLGLCTVDGVVYEEVSNQNLNISNGDATHDRKDIVIYDATAGNPAVVEGTPAAAPIPANIPSGDILLGIVLVEANETTSILDADITEDRVYANKRWAHTSVSANTTLNDAHYVVAVNATGGVRTITLPTAVGILGKVYVVKKIDSSANAVTVDGNVAETIDGSTTAVLTTQWHSIVIQSDGTNWIKIVIDKTNNEIRDAVEAATDSNTFKDADHTKLNGIETAATTDQSNAEIRTAVEAATDSNVFTDADHAKLNNTDPSGIIVMWHGLLSAVPTGWVLCDGDNSTPDLRDKFVRGAADAANPGATGGADTHTLSIAEMPSHAHGGGASGSVSNINAGGNTSARVASTGATGGGDAHNNMPAYYAIAYIMKT